MSGCEYGNVGIDLPLTVGIAHNKPCQRAVFTHQLRHTGLKHKFTAQTQDLLPQIADHRCQNIGSDVRLVII